MFFLYGILSTIAFFVILPFWLIAGLFKPKLVAGFKQKCGVYNLKNKVEKNRKTILFYAISVGEVIAIENLLKKTKESHPDKNIVLMTGTKTGQEIANKKLGVACDFITYFPFDFPFCIKNMLKKINPSTIFVMETELWPNFANITNKNKIPTYIINARISDRTYKSYKKLSFFFGPILKKYTAIFPQSEQDLQKFVSIGANSDKTEIMGNLKFDIKKPDETTLGFEKNPRDKILIAGSTHPGEDEIVLEVFCELKKEIQNLKLIIAPRHPERNEKVFELCKKTGLDVSKRSLSTTFNDSEIILLDTMGELGKLYALCDVAFIGGSFNKKGKGIGGHNPLEATIFKKPVVSGPSIHNFKDIYAILTSTDSAKIATTKKGLKDEIHNLLTKEQHYKKACEDCEKVFEQNQGALNFVIKVLQTVV